MRGNIGLSAVCILALAGFAEAAPLAWKLEEKQSAEYRIEVTAKAPAKARLVRMPAGIAVQAKDIEGERTVAFDVHDLSRLILRTVLSIPEGAKDDAELNWTVAFSNVDSRHLFPTLEVRAKVQVSGRKGAIQAIAEIKQGRDKNRSQIKSGSLSWTTLFDTRKNVAVSSTFEFDLQYSDTVEGKTTEHHEVSGGQLILNELVELTDKRFRKELDEAIKKGAEWLRGELRKRIDNKQMGHIALGLFALLRSGVSPKDATIERGFEVLATLPLERVYDVSLYIMALEARSVTRIPPKGNRSVPRYERGKVGGDDLAKMQSLADWLIVARITGFGRWNYTAYSMESPEGGGKGAEAARFDNSLTQFAVLALHAAHRAGAKVEAGVWTEVFKHFLECQMPPEGRGKHKISRSDQDVEKGEAEELATTVERRRSPTEMDEGVEYRGWSYTQHGHAYGSMTNAALSSLAIAADMLHVHGAFPSEWEGEFRRLTAEGLAWQAANYSVTTNPKKGGDPHYYYYLYSFEKACELLDVEAFDGKLWHDDGSKQLLAQQDAGGSWLEDDVKTGLALLFLNRATLKTTVNILSRRATTGGDEGRTRGAVNVPEAGGLVDLSNLVEAMRDASRKRQKELQDWFEAGLTQLEDVQQPLTYPALLTAYEDRNLKSWARKQLRAIAGDSSLRDTEDFQAFYEAWRQLDEAGPQRRYDRIPVIKEGFSHKNPLIRKLAMLTAVRLEAVELVADMAPLLEQKRDESIARSCLMALMGRSPKDPADAERWAETELAKALAEKQAERTLYAAVHGDEAARASVIAAGRKHLLVLSRLVREAPFADGARTILEAITGERMADIAWNEWFEANKAKIGADGKLKK